MHNVKIRFAYKAGFRRAWMVVSVIWLALTGFVFATSTNPFIQNIQAFIEWGICPVVALYALGAALAWIIEGFARPDN